RAGGRGNFGGSPKPPKRESNASLNCRTVRSRASEPGRVHTGAAACSSERNRAVSASADSTTLLRSAFHTRAISCRMSTNPGRPHFDAGGKYVPPENGFSPGVSQTLLGQPPDPVVAWTKVM